MVLVLVLGDIFIPTRIHDLPSKFKKLLVPGKIQQIVSTGNVCDRETWEYLRGIAADVRGVRGEYDEVGLSLSTSDTILDKSAQQADGACVLHGHQVVPLGDAEALSAVARKMDVDILISGGTHRFEAYEYDSRFFINPGSTTGAYSATWSPSTPTAEDSSVGTAAQSATSAPASSGLSESASQSTTATAPNDQSSKTDKRASSPTPSFALLDIQGTVVVTLAMNLWQTTWSWFGPDDRYVYQLIEGDVRVEKIEFRKSSS
ncbi:Vacuolar protein sorting-associated protein 29 [Microbotryomycetes sp. JL221]|nr:Vacuolar protein sorting-associated protein 29 [Microbotryomycetes sp. JL221]